MKTSSTSEKIRDENHYLRSSRLDYCTTVRNCSVVVVAPVMKRALKEMFTWAINCFPMGLLQNRILAPRVTITLARATS